MTRIAFFLLHSDVFFLNLDISELVGDWLTETVASHYQGPTWWYSTVFSSHFTSQALVIHCKCHFSNSLTGMGTVTVHICISNLTSMCVQEHKHVCTRFTTLEFRGTKSRKDCLPISFGFDMCPLQGAGISGDIHHWRVLWSAQGKLSRTLDFLQEASIWVIQPDFYPQKNLKNKRTGKKRGGVKGREEKNGHYYHCERKAIPQCPHVEDLIPSVASWEMLVKGKSLTQRNMGCQALPLLLPGCKVISPALLQAPAWMCCLSLGPKWYSWSKMSKLISQNKSFFFISWSSRELLLQWWESGHINSALFHLWRWGSQSKPLSFLAWFHSPCVWEFGDLEFLFYMKQQLWDILLQHRDLS